MTGWLEPIIALSFALSPASNHIQDYHRAVEPDHVISVDVTAGVELFDLVSIEGEIDTLCVAPWEDGGDWFGPYQVDYYFRAYVEYKGFTAGFEHLCRHPVITSGVNVTQWRGGHDKFWIEWRYQ